MSRETLAIVFGILVPCIWALGAVVGVITHDYTLFQITLPVVLAEAGWLFGAQFLKRNSNGNGEHK